MKKQRFQYGISGYRWALESFQVTKGLAGRKKTAVPLTSEERREVGCRFISGGFRLMEEPARYLYCPQAFCRADAPLAVRLGLFKLVRDDLMQRACRVETSTRCELDGAYRPVHITVSTVTANLNRPLTVWLRCA